MWVLRCTSPPVYFIKPQANGRNNSQHCLMLHVASVCTPCCTYALLRVAFTFNQVLRVSSFLRRTRDPGNSIADPAPCLACRWEMFSPSSSFCASFVHIDLTSNPSYYIAGIFFQQRTLDLVGYFEVTWHLTMKLFLVKISKRAKLQNLWRQKVTVHCYRQCWRTTAVTARFNKFPASKFPTIYQLYNESLEPDRFPQLLLGKQRFSGDKVNCFPRD